MSQTLVRNNVYDRIKRAVVSTLIYWMNNTISTDPNNPQGPQYQRLQGCGGVFSQPEYDTDSTNVSYPCVMCCYEGLRPQFLGGDSSARAFNWPVAILLLDNVAKGVIANEAAYAEWQKDLFDMFHQQKLFDYDLATGFPNLVQEVTGGLVEGNLIFDTKNPKFALVKMGVVATFEAWELRY